MAAVLCLGCPQTIGEVTRTLLQRTRAPLCTASPDLRGCRRPRVAGGGGGGRVGGGGGGGGALGVRGQQAPPSTEAEMDEETRREMEESMRQVNQLRQIRELQRRNIAAGIGDAQGTDERVVAM